MLIIITSLLIIGYALLYFTGLSYPNIFLASSVERTEDKIGIYSSIKTQENINSFFIYYWKDSSSHMLNCLLVCWEISHVRLRLKNSLGYVSMN